jgi:hypothetical protein
MTATRRAALLLLISLALPVTAVRAAPVSRNVTLLGHLDNYAGYSACCSYVHSDGREYAILGTTTGTSIVNITNPSAPYEVAFIPGLGSQWREMKQFKNYVYITTEATGGGVQIVRMLDPEHPVLVKTYTGTFNHEHTVSVDSTRSLLILNGTRLDGIQTGMRVRCLPDGLRARQLGPGRYPLRKRDHERHHARGRLLQSHESLRHHGLDLFRGPNPQRGDVAEREIPLRL